MKKNEIIVYECVQAGPPVCDKFYTLIQTDALNFVTYYGPHNEWTKSKEYPMSAWLDVQRKREQHGYRVMESRMIDYTMFLTIKKKLEQFIDEMGHAPDEVSEWQYLHKWGRLTAEQMQDLNHRYKLKKG